MDRASTSSSDPGPPDVIVSQGTGPTLRSIRRSPATIHLLILASAGVAIAYPTLAGWPPLSRLWWFLIAVLLYGGGALVALVMSLVQRRSAKGKPIDERAFDRRLFTEGVFIDFVFGAIALDQARGGWLFVGMLIIVGALLWTIWWLPPSKRITTSLTSALVERAPARVFQFVADDVNQPRYLPKIEAVEKISSGPVGPGTQFRRHERIGRKVVEGVSEVVDFMPDVRVSSRLVSRNSEALIHSTEVVTLEPTPRGTVLHHRLEVENTYNEALTGVILLVRLSKPAWVTRMSAGWARLKEILESSEFDR